MQHIEQDGLLWRGAFNLPTKLGLADAILFSLFFPYTPPQCSSAKLNFGGLGGSGCCPISLQACDVRGVLKKTLIKSNQKHNPK